MRLVNLEDVIICHAGDLGSTSFSIEHSINIVTYSASAADAIYAHVSNVIIDYSSPPFSGRIRVSGISFDNTLDFQNLSNVNGIHCTNCRFNGITYDSGGSFVGGTFLNQCYISGVVDITGAPVLMTNCTGNNSNQSYVVNAGAWLQVYGHVDDFGYITHTGGWMSLYGIKIWQTSGGNAINSNVVAGGAFSGLLFLNDCTFTSGQKVRIQGTQITGYGVGNTNLELNDLVISGSHINISPLTRYSGSIYVSGEVAAGSLEVSGVSSLSGVATFGSGGTSYSFPNTRGTNTQILATNGSGSVSWQSSSSNYVRTAVSDSESPYTILEADEIIGVTTASGIVTVTLPQISALSTPSKHKKYNIIDEGGNAASNNITIATTGGDTINNAASPLIISSNNAITNLYSDGGTNWVLY